MVKPSGPVLVIGATGQRADHPGLMTLQAWLRAAGWQAGKTRETR